LLLLLLLLQCAVVAKDAPLAPPFVDRYCRITTTNFSFVSNYFSVAFITD